MKLNGPAAIRCRFGALGIAIAGALHACSVDPAQANAIVEGDTARAIDKHLSNAEDEGFSGVVLVAKNGEVLFSKGYGLADRERDIAYTSDTVFSIGSITKQFTAAAILKLEEDGKLSVYSTVAEFFPEAPADKRSITLHELLTHTSGLQSDVGGDYSRMTTEQFLSRVFSSKRESPGSFRYSNIGYSLLGIVIERVSGIGYESYLAQEFFGPLGMTRTGYVLPAWNRDQVALGYQENGRTWGSPLDKPWADDGPYWGLRANGGILSTVGDMYRWVMALRDGEALSPVSMSKLWTGYAVDAPDVSPPPMYAYGWRIITTKRGTRMISHNGSNGIFAAGVRNFEDEDVVMVLASNTEGKEVWWYEQPELWRIVFGS